MSTIKLMIISLFAITFLNACSRDLFITHNGNMPTNERINNVVVGASKEEVIRELGAPSSVVSLDKNTWIYMSQDIERVAFFAPKEVRREVLTIKFNNHDEVMDITKLSEQNGQEIIVAEEKTETYGQQPGWFQKVFGTLGSYNPLGGTGFN